MCFIVLLVWAPWHECISISPSSGVHLSIPNSSGDDGLELSDATDAPTLSSLTHLILCAGHAVLTGTDVHSLDDERNWFLLDYQKDQLSTFVAHIQRSVELTRADPAALLIFSGGETRAAAGPRSEAQGYWTAANLQHWWNDKPRTTEADGENSSDLPDEVSLRAVTEEYSRDSFENLLFSVCRFKEVTGAYPSRITVVGFSFKGPRFTELHRGAIRFPEEYFSYDGIDPPILQENTPTAAAARAALLASEQSQSYQPFVTDPYSCHAPLLTKKKTRNPFRRSHAGYEHGCPEIKLLLRHCGRSVFTGALPWDVDGIQMKKEQVKEQQRVQQDN
jgi:hypothetical protein